MQERNLAPASIKAIEAVLLKGEDAKVSNGPDGSIKVYSTKTKLILDTGKIKKRAPR